MVVEVRFNWPGSELKRGNNKTLELGNIQALSWTENFGSSRIYTRDGSSVEDELGQRTTARLIIHVCIRTSRRITRPDELSIAIVRHATADEPWLWMTRQDGWSVSMYKCGQKANYPRKLHLATRGQWLFSINYEFKKRWRRWWTSQLKFRTGPWRSKNKRAQTVGNRTFRYLELSCTCSNWRERRFTFHYSWIKSALLQRLFYSSEKA